MTLTGSVSDVAIAERDFCLSSTGSTAYPSPVEQTSLVIDLLAVISVILLLVIRGLSAHICHRQSKPSCAQTLTKGVYLKRSRYNKISKLPHKVGLKKEIKETRFVTNLRQTYFLALLTLSCFIFFRSFNIFSSTHKLVASEAQQSESQSSTTSIKPLAITTPPDGSVVDDSDLTISGIAEPGQKIVVLQQIGNAVADESGMWRMNINLLAPENRHSYLMAIDSGDAKQAGISIDFRDSINRSPSNNSLSGNRQTVYRAVDLRGDIEDLVIFNLDQVCPLNQEALEEEQAIIISYISTVDGQDISGAIDITDCDRQAKEYFSGEFEDQQGCHGEVKITALSRNRDALGKIEQATLVWDSSSCQGEGEVPAAVVRRES
jgi:hypothetical protein